MGEKIKRPINSFVLRKPRWGKSEPFTIGKHLKLRCFTNKTLDKIHYYTNKNSWMTLDIFKKEMWLWDSELRKFNRKILILVDNLQHIQIILIYRRI